MLLAAVANWHGRASRCSWHTRYGSGEVLREQLPLFYVCIYTKVHILLAAVANWHTSAYISIRQHTSAYVSIHILLGAVP